MNDYSDEIVELYNRIYHVVVTYVKKEGSVKLCNEIIVTDCEYTYRVNEIFYDEDLYGDEIQCVTNCGRGLISLAEIMNFCIYDIYMEILDCCIKNS
jgi:hypothetical protein